MNNRQNIFTAFLDLLKVKHTNDFSNKFYNEHPHKYNLFGLSKMLSDYEIENAGTKIENKENDIFNVECPFVAHFGGDFVIVKKIDEPLNLSVPQSSDPSVPQFLSPSILFIRNGKETNIPVEQFLQSWSGIVLLAETTPNSIEPDYKEHRKKEFFNIIQKSIIFLTGILFSVLHILTMHYIPN